MSVSPNSSSSIKILIVDDSAFARKTLRGHLENLGYSVEEAPNGTEAILKVLLEKPEVVILDLVMHGLSGLEVLRTLRAQQPQLPVIISSADVQDETAAMAQRAGARGILTKPVKRTQLGPALEKVLSGADLWS